MQIQLSDHFTYGKLLRFVLPSIVMMIFTSIYGVVDGLFVSNFVGKIPFAAVNLIMPFLMILGTIGFMIGTGGSAIVAKTMGEGKQEKANEYFTMLVKVTIYCGLVLSILGIIFTRPISVLLGAEGEMLEYCVTYGRIILIALTAFMLQNVFQSFFVTAEKPQLGLYVTVLAGLTNIILDFVLIAVLKWGIAGAAIATATSQIIGGLIPMIYFFRKNSSRLRFTKSKFNGQILLRTCTNGASELMTNVSMSLVNILYNFQLMKFVGEDGVAAYGVIMYISFIFIAIFIGYSIGSAPIVGYNYGAENYSELKNLFKKSLILITIWNIALTVLALVTASSLAKVFVGYDADLLALTSHGYKLYSLSFLIAGFNIFGSAFFTALNNGIISGLISFLRTLVFQVVAVMVLPIFFGLNGIWLAIVVAELCALIVTALFFITKRKHYHYF